jgi:hypothetical protein
MKKCRCIPHKFSRLIKAALLLGGLCALKEFCLEQTEGFSILGISSRWPTDKRWELFCPKEDLFDAFAQPYTYFGCGAQSYVFFSRDQNYVLKFFKQASYEIPLWMRLPLPWPLTRYRLKKRVSREEKRTRDFLSTANAYKSLKEESGLIFVHLNKTDDLRQTLILIDKLGISHRINLDDFDFVLQKKAVMAYTHIDHLMREKKIPDAEEALSSLIHLLAEECRLKMIDRHPNIRKNFGFIDNKAVQIDSGRFKEIIEREGIEQTHSEISSWLKANHPSLVEHFESEYHSVLKPLL